MGQQGSNNDKAKVKGKEVTAIIDTGCSGVIILKGCMSRLRLEADAEIDFTLNMLIKMLKKEG